MTSPLPRGEPPSLPPRAAGCPFFLRRRSAGEAGAAAGGAGPPGSAFAPLQARGGGHPAAEERGLGSLMGRRGPGPVGPGKS